MSHKYQDPYSGKIKSLRHNYNQKEKQKLLKLYKYGADRWYPWPVVWSEYVWDKTTYCNIPAKNAYLTRNYRRQYSKWLKKCGHRKNRRVKNEITNYTYNKNFEYWWSLD